MATDPSHSEETSAGKPEGFPNAERSVLEASVEDTIRHYLGFQHESSAEGALRRYWEEMAREERSGSELDRYLIGNRGTAGPPEEEVRRFLLVDESGNELTPVKSLEKQRELLSTIAQELVRQREDARREEADALAHQRRSFRVAAWSLGVAALALLTPIVEIALKLLGVNL